MSFADILSSSVFCRHADTSTVIPAFPPLPATLAFPPLRTTATTRSPTMEELMNHPFIANAPDKSILAAAAAGSAPAPKSSVAQQFKEANTKKPPQPKAPAPKAAAPPQRRQSVSEGFGDDYVEEDFDDGFGSDDDEDIDIDYEAASPGAGREEELDEWGF